MIRLAHRVILAWGRERCFMAFLCGAIGALAMAPVDFTPALFVTFTGAVWLIDGSASAGKPLSLRSIWNAALAGWWFGFGYFIAGLWWLGIAFTVDADEFLWAMPLGVVGLPAALALFHALGFALSRLLWSNIGGRIFALTAGLGFAEWLRGHIFTGFPWNVFGQALGDYLVTGQAAALIGVEGLSVVSIAIFATPALIGTGNTWRARYRGVIYAACGLAVIISYGALRLYLNGGLQPQLDKAHVVEGVRLRIVQPNISMFDKKNAQNGEKLLQTYLKLSDKSTSPANTSILDVTHVFWPESPFPFILSQAPQALKMIGQQLQGKVTLVTGAVRAEVKVDGSRSEQYYNSIQVVGGDGTIVGSYDKFHLVPFGEYLPAPFQSALNTLGLRQFVHVPGGFSPGTIARPLDIKGLPLAIPLICYEAIFPDAPLLEGLSAKPGEPASRAGFILNLTNDAWFGQSSGPYQHLAQTRLRAIEQGIPVVRSANTGISAVIDPFGRFQRILPMNVADVIDSPLPKAIHKTVYSSFGKWLVLPLLLIAMIMAMISAINSRKYSVNAVG